MIYILFLVLGFYITFGFYHFIVYLGRKHDKRNLFFSLLVISFSLYLYSEYISVILKQENNIGVVLVGIISKSFSVTGLALFTYSSLKLYKMRNTIIYGLPVCVIFPAIVACLNILLSQNFEKIISLFATVLGVGFGLYCWGSVIYYFFEKEEKRYKDFWMKVIFISTTFHFCFHIAVTILYYYDFFYLEIIITNLGLIAITIVYAIYLTTNFNQEHKRLQQLTHHLQKEVDTATLDIRTQKESNKRFFISFAHEMKSPLTSMLNALIDLKKKIQFFPEVKSLEANLKKLIRDVGNFLDADKFDIFIKEYESFEIIDFSHLVRSKFEQYAEISNKKKDKKFIDHIDTGLCIKSHPVVVERIVDNVLSNADKYTEFGSVTVTLRKSGGKIVFEVADTGKGIAEDDLDKIFLEYYQVEHSFHKGVGMGLHITKKYVESLKGTIEVESIPGKGSTFTVALPFYTLKAGEIGVRFDELESPVVFYDDEEEDEPVYDGTKPVILIVEDDVQIRSLLKNALLEEYAVYTALNGEEALEKLKKIPLPALILSDIMMDKMDGEELIGHLEADYADIPLIFITAKTEKDNKLKTLRLGAMDYIMKPFDIEEVKAKVGSHIKKRKHQLEKRNTPLTSRDEESVAEVLMRRNGHFGLSRQEMKYLTLYLTGKENPEIINVLKIKTSDQGRKIKLRIKRKLGVIDRFEIVSLYGLTP